MLRFIGDWMDAASICSEEQHISKPHLLTTKRSEYMTRTRNSKQTACPAFSNFSVKLCQHKPLFINSSFTQLIPAYYLHITATENFINILTSLIYFSTWNTLSVCEHMCPGVCFYSWSQFILIAGLPGAEILESLPLAHFPRTRLYL